MAERELAGRPEPPPPEPAVPGVVHLPALISDEFGVSRAVAREQIVLGMILIDGEEWSGDRLDIAVDELRGREIMVRGRDRSFRMVYPR